MFKRPGIHIQHFNDGRVIYFSTTTAQWLPSYPQAGKSAILACSQHRYIRWQGNPHPFTIDQRWERYLHLFTTVYWQATCFFPSRSGHFNDGRVKTESLTIFPLYFRHYVFFQSMRCQLQRESVKTPNGAAFYWAVGPAPMGSWSCNSDDQTRW